MHFAIKNPYILYAVLTIATFVTELIEKKNPSITPGGEDFVYSWGLFWATSHTLIEMHVTAFTDLPEPT